MSDVAIVSIALGIFVVAVRVPMVIAPEAAIRLMRRLIETDASIRALGVFSAALGGAVLWLVGDEEGMLAGLLVGLSWAIEGAAWLLMLPVPAAYRGLVEGFLGVIEDTTVVRVLALFGVLVGALLIWAGLTLGA